LKKYYDDPKYNAAFGRCIDVMASLMQKYGPALLEAPKNNQKKDQHDKNHAA